MLFGPLFRKFRRKCGWTDTQLANTGCVSLSHIRLVEVGTRAPFSPELIERILATMGASDRLGYWLELAAYDRMLRRAPPQLMAVAGELMMAIGQRYADGSLTSGSVEALKQMMEG